MSSQAWSCLWLLKYLKVILISVQSLFMPNIMIMNNFWQFHLNTFFHNMMKNYVTVSGVNLSLLSRVMSSRLSRGTFNGGLLSTEAGTLARVIADATITIAGYFGEGHLLNITLLPSLVICIASIVATFCTYNSLY